MDTDTSNREKYTVIASYNFPTNLMPALHHAIFQLLVGVEQRHSQSNLDNYAGNLRALAVEAFVTLERKERV